MSRRHLLRSQICPKCQDIAEDPWQGAGILGVQWGMDDQANKLIKQYVRWKRKGERRGGGGSRRLARGPRGAVTPSTGAGGVRPGGGRAPEGQEWSEGRDRC